MLRAVPPRLALVTFACASACASALVLAPLAACGGAAPSDLLTGTYSGPTGGVDASIDTGPVQGGGHDAGARPDVSTVQDSGGVADASVPDTSVDETGGGGAGTVFCGNDTCTTPQQYCCVTGAGQGSTPSYSCKMGQASCGSTAGPGTPVHCDKTADCPSGDVCCGSDYNGYYADVSCQTSCTGTGFTPVQFCDSSGSDCPQGMTCQMSGVLTGYWVCR
jgi:hypothetical protein